MSTPVTLACGIIAFPQSGPVMSGSELAPQLQLDPARSAPRETALVSGGTGFLGASLTAR
ncbi:MAG TPA: hypothetical protein VGS19_14470 [Streptosporangiaceae bacterium]|nr:hypothetical protein [Streptosporangiaceae bacterium]